METTIQTSQSSSEKKYKWSIKLIWKEFLARKRHLERSRIRRTNNICRDLFIIGINLRQILEEKKPKHYKIFGFTEYSSKLQKEKYSWEDH